MTRRPTNRRLCRRALGGKKALRGEEGLCRAACPHPRRQNHEERKLNLSAQGGLHLGHPWVSTWRRPCSQRVPQQARTDPCPDQGRPPGWFLAKEAWPSPSDRAMASPQRGLKNTIFLATLGTCGSPTRGASRPPLPWPASNSGVPPGGAEDLRSHGILEHPFLPGHVNPGVLTPRGKRGRVCRALFGVLSASSSTCQVQSSK